jgi:hypothetical protein
MHPSNTKSLPNLATVNPLDISSVPVCGIAAVSFYFFRKRNEFTRRGYHSTKIDITRGETKRPGVSRVDYHDGNYGLQFSIKWVKKNCNEAADADAGCTAASSFSTCTAPAVDSGGDDQRRPPRPPQLGGGRHCDRCRRRAFRKARAWGAYRLFWEAGSSTAAADSRG